jgi:branched-chain amino acid aminotransferase
MMETCLLNQFIYNDELKSSCDFNPELLETGPGIYEVFRVIKGIPLFLEEHILRFYRSASMESYVPEFSENELKSRLKILIETNNLKNGNVRFQYFIQPNKQAVLMAWVASTLYPSQEDFEKGVVIETLNASRNKPNSKRTNLPVRLMAEKIIENKNLAEVLLINRNGLVTEGHRSNIFFVKDKSVITSSEELVLPGITRDKIIQLANEEGIEVVEKHIDITELQDFSSSFLSSTSKDVLPVRQIDEHTYTVGNQIVGKLSSLYNELVEEHLAGFSW